MLSYQNLQSITQTAHHRVHIQHSNMPSSEQELTAQLDESDSQAELVDIDDQVVFLRIGLVRHNRLVITELQLNCSHCGCKHLRHMHVSSSPCT